MLGVAMAADTTRIPVTFWLDANTMRELEQRRLERGLNLDVFFRVAVSEYIGRTTMPSPTDPETLSRLVSHS